jgi:putative colanic acid biosynthesis acetyltransferase WcaF
MHLENQPQQVVCQDLSQFTLPEDYRGRPAWFCQLWWLIESLIVAPSPQVAFAWRAWWWRRFGARLGKNVRIRPGVRLTFPWRFEAGDFVWIGNDVRIYNLAPILIGEHAVVSQGSHLCAGSHDPESSCFPLRTAPISIGAQAWIAADCFVGPGVVIGRGAVVGARSVVFSDMPPYMICHGHPCRPRRPRKRS